MGSSSCECSLRECTTLRQKYMAKRWGAVGSGGRNPVLLPLTRLLLSSSGRIGCNLMLGMGSFIGDGWQYRNW